jgi:hypothetical protein
MFGSHQFKEMKKQLEQIGRAALKKVDDQYVCHTLHFSYLTDVSLLLQTHINFPRFLPIFPDFLEQLSHLAPIY